VLMEQGAGYRSKQVTATLAGGKKKSVFAFHYEHEPAGELIEDGDWAKAFTDAVR
jgi:gamma-glutamylcyclotransferase (GGCT)/AIG2-like uncharacterized protein YtfP